MTIFDKMIKCWYFVDSCSIWRCSISRLIQEQICLELIAEAKLEELQTRIGRKFKKPYLLALAMTHSSCRRLVQGRVTVQCNQRLEFLGDRILNAAVGTYLYHRYPLGFEGFVSQHDQQLKSNALLALASRTLGLGDFLVFDQAEAPHFRRAKGHEKMLADTFEAVVGAIFLDGGFPAASKFLDRHLFDHADEFLAMKHSPPPKVDLEEPTHSAIEQLA